MVACTKIRAPLLYATSVLLVMAVCLIGRQMDQANQENGQVYYMEIKTETRKKSGECIYS